MKKDGAKAAQWQALEEQIQEELEKARRRAAVAGSFAEMEEIALEAGQIIQQAMLGALAEQQEPGGRPSCPECGVKMQRRGQNQRQLKTSTGTVAIERQRWVCPVCGTGVFPPGSETEA